jgi:hypothetical protein
VHMVTLRKWLDYLWTIRRYSVSTGTKYEWKFKMAKKLTILSIDVHPDGWGTPSNVWIQKMKISFLFYIGKILLQFEQFMKMIMKQRRSFTILSVNNLNVHFFWYLYRFVITSRNRYSHLLCLHHKSRS